MTAWYSGAGWGWCSVIVNIPAIVVLWGTVFTAMFFAVRFALRQRSDPPPRWAPVLPGPKAWWRPALRESKWTTTNFTAA